MTGKPCDHVNALGKNKSAFIISPFGFPYDSLYAARGPVWKALYSQGFGAKRADQTLRIGSIMCQSICQEIISNQLLLADISAPNANVYYELGLAYGLRRPIMLCASENTRNPHVALFEHSPNAILTLIRYSSVSDLARELEKTLGSCASSPMLFPHENVSVPDRSILILENEAGGVSGVYESILRRLEYEFEDALAPLTSSERKSFTKEQDEWRRWEATSKVVANTPSLDDLVKAVNGCRVCIVDTTAYISGAMPVTNPYMYFCLGLAHGLEKEVIPITNTRHSESAPFDVRGFRHIFFDREEELESNLKHIIPQIGVEHFKERVNAPYRRIWDCLLAGNKTLSIVYCGRPLDSSRGKRTNIDSWDSKAVSEASFYLARQYPTSLIRVASPKTKIPNPTEEHVSNITRELKEEYANSVLVGSPDNNDYAEVVLSKIYGHEPYRTKLTSQRKKHGFTFQKNNLLGEIKSSFYRKGKENLVETAMKSFRIEDDRSYGVLTVARNPFATDKDSVVMVLSGFTGIATWGLLRILINVESEEDRRRLEDTKQPNEAERLEEDMSNALRLLLRDFDQNLKKPITVLVSFHIETIEGVAGDDRALTGVNIMEVTRPK